jgi:hypothetical protein
MKKLTLSILVVCALFSTNIALAGAPFNNLEGVGGIAFNRKYELLVRNGLELTREVLYCMVDSEPLWATCSK